MQSTDEDATVIAAFRERGDRERLQLAREMATAPQPPSLAAVKAMLADEDVSWVRSALETVLARLGGGTPEAVMSGELDEADELYAQALHAATQDVLHELSPLVGRAHFAAREMLGPELAGTTLERELLALKRTMDALGRLSAASAVPIPVEFDLAECLDNLAAAQRESGPGEVRASGPGPHVVLSDQTLVELVVTNLLRNAIDATDALMVDDPSARSVIVNWGTRAGSHWVSVLDRGEGLPAQASELFERGVTLRDQGSGLGLTTAWRAARSLGGTVELVPNDQGGTTAVFRWPAEDRVA
jgi:signal transduction histidine kinase